MIFKEMICTTLRTDTSQVYKPPVLVGEFINRFPRRRINVGVVVLDNEIFITNFYWGFINVFRDGLWIKTIGGKGAAPRRLEGPQHLVISDRRELFVSDIAQQVQVFSPNGRFLRLWKTSDYIDALTLVQDRVWLAGSGSESDVRRLYRVHVLDQMGELQFAMNKRTSITAMSFNKASSTVIMTYQGGVDVHSLDGTFLATKRFTDCPTLFVQSVACSWFGEWVLVCRANREWFCIVLRPDLQIVCVTSPSASHELSGVTLSNKGDIVFLCRRSVTEYCLLWSALSPAMYFGPPQKKTKWND